MDELGVPTPRSRSRSKTPFILRSQCDKEHCTDVDHDHHVPVKRVPTVPTVDEEQHTPGNVRTSARTTRKTIVVAATTVETSHKASVVITASSTNITNATRSVKSTATSSATLQTAAGTSANGSNSIAGEANAFSDLSNKEMNQNELNTMFADNSRLRMRTSTPIQSSSAAAAAGGGRIGRTMERKSLATSVLTADGNDHVPYREWHDAGEYWNKYPKTDYTYSRLSPHRREIVPGVIAMPNMSRRSLEQHHDRVNVMAEKAAPGFASFIRKRYQATNYQATEQRRHASHYDSQDSQDEVDEVRVAQHRRSWRYSEIRIVRWMSTIVEIWSTFLYTSFGGGGRTASNVYHTRAQPEASWFSRISSVVTGSILSVFRYVYLAISTVLFFDTWLLRSGNASSPTKKRFLLLLLILLPMLLIAGAYYLIDIPFPPVNIIDEFGSLDRVFEAVQWENVQTHAQHQYDRLASAGSAGWTQANELWYSAYETVVAVTKENLGI